MTCFLTSSHNVPGRPELNPANGFAASLLQAVPSPCRGLAVCASPDSYEETDFFCGSVREGFECSGVQFSRFDILDRRTQDQAPELVHGAQLIILMGGHVPTQNRFFQEIRLRELMADCDCVVTGISAGSMNAADVVYAQPELEGESVDPDYQRFLPGLNLTKTMILPHHQRAWHAWLDGKRLFEDISVEDSMGREFYCLPDGSLLYIENGHEEIRGECWLWADGRHTKVCGEGQVLVLRD